MKTWIALIAAWVVVLVVGVARWTNWTPRFPSRPHIAWNTNTVYVTNIVQMIVVTNYLTEAKPTPLTEVSNILIGQITCTNLYLTNMSYIVATNHMNYSNVAIAWRTP